MKIIDLYKGFEREPLLEISRRNDEGKSLVLFKIWIGFFDFIINQIKPNNEGMWEGVPLYYHTDTGWNEESEWKCEDIRLFIQQLEAIDLNKLGDDYRKVLLELIIMCKDCLNNKEDLYFVYD
ncbi:hypothetical protein [Flavivirga spongiicola]|uniref:Uncharacterized protein n=1 Tax=Flavivirga spongiicola TaxID=421621 RepID=A0ABU7XMP1_9FLAO|nr:hypothetical protein [Flavivirga sp. MEBiC05379]MDO5981455.1 hypothetical protein [Flavivirga sp. MEBiC05379]MDO5981903.1 hypothetical protein [Flavivirga sp. MEBiC05379]